jgi:DNA polymerase
MPEPADSPIRLRAAVRRGLEHLARIGVRRVRRPPPTPPEPVPAAAPVAAPRTDPPPAEPPSAVASAGVSLFVREIVAPSQVVDRTGNAEMLSPVKAEVDGCTRCGLCRTRTNTVFGEGDPQARLVFVGEGPGADEDATGRPFVGRAGQLLTKMIEAMKLRRQDVYICNVVKCRPPDNRVPAPEEVFHCEPYLHRQLEIIRPQVICALGGTAACTLLETKETLGRLRGRWLQWRGIKLMATYHPSYLLRPQGQKDKPKAWSDLQMIMKELGIPVK